MAPPTDTRVGASSNINEVSEKRSDVGVLVWVKVKLNNQLLDSLLDSGASRSCIARRCVTASPLLKKLPRFPYTGPPLLDVNKNPIPVVDTIRVSLIIGTPALCVQMDFVVIDDLPYSSILGGDFLNKLESWGINNKTRLLNMNDSVCPVFAQPQHDNNINLITQSKTSLLPGESATIHATVKDVVRFVQLQSSLSLRRAIAEWKSAPMS